MEDKFDRNVNASSTSGQGLILSATRRLIKECWNTNHFIVITHGASQLSKLTHVENNSYVMSGLFESIKNRDFEGETNDLSKAGKK